MSIMGTASADVLNGTTGADTIDGLAGADTMTGLAGDDRYVVDDVNDVIVEGVNGGFDTVWSSSGNTTLSDQVENLTLTKPVTDAPGFVVYGRGNDQANVIVGYAELHSTTVFGAHGAIVSQIDIYDPNILSGGGGNDILDGAMGRDDLDGGTGADTMRGGAGSDVYHVDDLGDLVIEDAPFNAPVYPYIGDGLPNNERDTVFASVDYTLGLNVEDLILNDGAQRGSGNELDNTLSGNGSSNILLGLQGDDSLYGGAGDDVLSGGDGRDSLSGGLGNDLLAGDLGQDQINGDEGNDTLDGGEGNDSLVGGAGADTYRFGRTSGQDSVLADASDVIAMDATLSRSDLSRVGYGVGESIVLGFDGIAGLSLNVQGISAWRDGLALRWADGSTMSGADLLALLPPPAPINGTSGNDSLTGGFANDTLSGLGGNDTLFGDLGDDVLSGGAGDDYVIGSDGNDTLMGDEGNDYLSSGEGDNRLLGGEGNDTLFAFNGTNSLYGGGGNDQLYGGFGGSAFTLMEGGAGNDYYSVSSGAFQLNEYADEGRDTLEGALATMILPTQVEVLSMTSGALVGKGNDQDNLIQATGQRVGHITTGPYGAGFDLYSGVEMFGLGGNDTLVASAGWDTMHGGVGNDVYRLTLPLDVQNQMYSPRLAVVDESVGEGVDEIILDIRNSASFDYQLADQVEKLTLLGTSIHATGNALGNTITQAAGSFVSVWLDGGDGSDTLGGAAGSDTLVGGLGNDVLSGDAGADTYRFGRGDGQDLVHADSLDVLQLGANITRADLVISASTVGAAPAVTIGIAGTTDTITLDKAGSWAGLTLQLADGTALNGNELVDIAQRVPGISLTGTSGKDKLTGGAGDDTLSALAGADTLTGGKGNDRLIGGKGSDTYLYAVGDGRDTIVENDSTLFNSDLLKVSGATSRQLWLTRSGNDLQIAVIGTRDQVTVQDWYVSSANRVEKITAGDGKSVSASKVNALVNAMASMTPPAFGQTTLPTDTAASLSKVLAANWS